MLRLGEKGKCMDLKECPYCHANLDGGDIYEYFFKEYEGDEKRALETAECYGWTKEHPRRFGLAVGQYDLGLDVTTHWTCPKCEKTIWTLFKSKDSGESL